VAFSLLRPLFYTLPQQWRKEYVCLFSSSRPFSLFPAECRRRRTSPSFSSPFAIPSLLRKMERHERPSSPPLLPMNFILCLFLPPFPSSLFEEEQAGAAKRTSPRLFSSLHFLRWTNLDATLSFSFFSFLLFSHDSGAVGCSRDFLISIFSYSSVVFFVSSFSSFPSPYPLTAKNVKSV